MGICFLKESTKLLLLYLFKLTQQFNLQIAFLQPLIFFSMSLEAVGSTEEFFVEVWSQLYMLFTGPWEDRTLQVLVLL